MSAETNWTKGTWALVIRPRGPDEIRSSDERAELICEFPFGASNGSELEANAHLIAAAPELYDAAHNAAGVLIACCKPAGGCDDDHAIRDAIERLEDALTKARGAA